MITYIRHIHVDNSHTYEAPDKRFIPEAVGNSDYDRMLVEVSEGQAEIQDVTDPVPPVAPVLTIRQTTFDEIMVDTTTTSATPVDLMSRTLTTLAGALHIQFTCAMSLTQANTDAVFAILVDTVDKRGAVVVASGANKGGCAAVMVRVPVAAGSHTVTVRWSVSAGTGRIRPATVLAEHAALRVQEVAE